jgi:hypothetical protein
VDQVHQGLSPSQRGARRAALADAKEESLLVEETVARSAVITDPVHNALVRARDEHAPMVANARERDREMAGHQRRLDGLWRARVGQE